MKLSHAEARKVKLVEYLDDAMEVETVDCAMVYKYCDGSTLTIRMEATPKGQKLKPK